MNFLPNRIIQLLCGGKKNASEDVKLFLTESLLFSPRKKEQKYNNLKNGGYNCRLQNQVEIGQFCHTN